MANLRDLMDGKAVDANAKDDVFKHLANTQKAKNAYDIQKTKLHISLAPTRQLMNIVDNDHGIQNAPNGQDPNGGNPNDPANQQAKPGQQPNTAAKPGQPGAQGQKKTGFPNANKTSTKDKMANNKNGKTVGGKKGIEVSVKAGGPGSGRHKEAIGHLTKAAKIASKLGSSSTAKMANAIAQRLKQGQNITSDHTDKIMQHQDKHSDNAARYADKMDYAKNNKTETKYDKLSYAHQDLADHLEKAHTYLSKDDVKANDYHDDPGMSVTPGRTVGLSSKALKAGGPGSGRKSQGGKSGNTGAGKAFLIGKHNEVRDQVISRMKEASKPSDYKGLSQAIEKLKEAKGHIDNGRFEKAISSITDAGGHLGNFGK